MMCHIFNLVKKLLNGSTQVILSVCLLPYHIFKPIFISLVHEQLQQQCSPTQETFNSCHPLSGIIEVTTFHLQIKKYIKYIIFFKVKISRYMWSYGHMHDDNFLSPSAAEELPVSSRCNKKFNRPCDVPSAGQVVSSSNPHTL